jgi:hypothetical protein
VCCVGWGGVERGGVMGCAVVCCSSCALSGDGGLVSCAVMFCGAEAPATLSWCTYMRDTVKAVTPRLAHISAPSPCSCVLTLLPPVVCRCCCCCLSSAAAAATCRLLLLLQPWTWVLETTWMLAHVQPLLRLVSAHVFGLACLAPGCFVGAVRRCFSVC